MSQNFWPKPFKYLEHAKSFVITLSVIISLALAGIFFLLYLRTNDLILHQAKEQAAAYVNLIHHARTWNYDYGGVYVEKKGGVRSNPHLEKLGIEPDIRAEAGKTLTLRNHAIMIAEISKITEEHDGTKFRVISLTPLDPGNSPDPFERQELIKLSKGAKEGYSWEISSPHPPTFRYLSPIYVENSCLGCHADQGYKEGSIIGAVSVTIPVRDLLDHAEMNKLVVFLAAIATIGLLVAITYFLTWRLANRLDDAQKKLRKQARTDELTGLRNRRHVMNRLSEEFQRAVRLGEPLSMIIMDIDHFKRINDTYGHPFGDKVLKKVSECLQRTVRSYDILGRIGGEEFLIISPGASLEEASVLAERLRHNIRMEKVTDSDKEVSVTVSAGLTLLRSDDSEPEQLLKRADNALYQAKQEGRDRVVTA